MKAILIDPENRTVSEIDYSGGLRAKAALPGIYECLQCSTIDAIQGFTHNDVAYVDDEGLLIDGPAYFFQTAHGHRISGRALVVNTNDEGGDLAPRSTVAEIAAQVRFLGELDADNPARPQPGFTFVSFD